MARPKLLQQAKGKRSSSRLGASAPKPTGDVAALSAGQGRFPWVRLPALLVIVGAIWVLYALFTNPRFRVNEVDVIGASIVRAEDLQRAIQVLGTSIFRLNTADLAASLESEFGCIERASVQCQLPATVLVTIQERKPVFVWASGGKYWWVDSGGVILGTAPESGDLVVVHDIKGHDSDPQGEIIGVPWMLAEQLAEVLPDNKSYDYTSEAGFILYVTAARWPVYLGHGGDAQLKIALLRSLASQLLASSNNVEYIDLRNEQRPIFKKR